MSSESEKPKNRKVSQALPIVLGVSVVLVGLWWGIPTYRKAKADARVDELCTKDGGIKVYETVKLPEDRFDQHGNVRVPFEPGSGDDFYLRVEKQWIVPYTSEGDISIARQSFKLYRASDKKLLGEAVSYLRRGGDPLSPAHPSSYRCPEDTGVEKKVFTRN